MDFDKINDFDITKIKIPYNWVLIKVDQDHDTYHNTATGDDTGIYVAPWGINQAEHLALTGEVIAVPQRLRYHGQTLKRLKADNMRTPSDQQYIADLRRESMAYDVPMELPVGIRVYFEYTTRLNAFKEGRAIENSDGKYILIPYDFLIMAFRPETDFKAVKISDVYMLNGHVLIKPLEYATEKGVNNVRGYKTENDLFLPVSEEAKYVHKNNMWYANVLSAGCGVKSYADFPKAIPDDLTVGKPGQKIVYDGRQQKRLEVEHHRVIFRSHVFYRIHRKDIIFVLEDGKIS